MRSIRDHPDPWALASITIVVIATLAVAPVAVMGGNTVYLNGDDITVKVYDTGSFIIDPLDFPSRYYDTSSWYWSFNIDGAITTTYNPLALDKVVTPTHLADTGEVRTQYLLGEDVLVDLTYREAGPAAEVTATFINTGQTHHTVGARHLYDLKDKVLTPPGQPPVTNEKEFISPPFNRIDIFEQGHKVGILTMGEGMGATEPSRLIFGHYQETKTEGWDHEVNESLELGNEPSVLVYWEGVHLPPGGSHVIKHFMGSSSPKRDVSVTDLVMESVSADPVDAFIDKTRTVTAVARNTGSSSVTAEVNFIITSDGGEYIAAGSKTKTLPPSTSVTFEWSYKVRKTAETRAMAVVDPLDDPVPEDNYGETMISATPSPYKVRLFFEDGTRIDYISINSGEKAKSILLVSNKGTAKDTVRLTVPDLPDDWEANFNVSRVHLEPGQSAKVKVVIKTSGQNKYYNYGLDIRGRSVEGDVSDEVLQFISFSDRIAKAGGNISVDGNKTSGTGDPGSGDNGGDDQTPPRITEPDEAPIQMDRTQLTLLIVVVIAVLIGSVVAYQIYLLGSKRSMKNILEDLYHKLYRIDTADAYRKAIFKAYEEMCKEIAVYGHERKEHITPKEFEKEIRKYLPVDKKNLHVLTKLFEEARYSDHVFTEDKKKKALKALRGIIDSLEEVTTFEEVEEGGSWLGRKT